MKRIVFFVILLLSMGTVTAQVLTLQECVAIGLENNSNVNISRNNVETADFDITGSLRGILPTISATVDRGEREDGASEFLDISPVGIDSLGNVVYEQKVRKNPASNRSSSSASLNISQTLVDGGIWWNQIRKSKTDQKAALRQYESDRQYLIRDIEEAYLNLLKQEKLYDVYQVAVERSQEQLDRTQKMYELGSKAKLDVYQTKVNLGNDRINLLTQKNTVEDARRNLNILMGRNPATPLKIASVDEVIESLPGTEELISTSRENQPLLKKNELNIKSRELGTSLSYGLLWPQFSLYVSYSRFHENFEKIYTNLDQNYRLSYGLRLSWNIFNGLNDYVSIEKSKIAEKTARENFLAYKRQLESNIHQLYENYNSYVEIIGINRENLAAAREELRLAQERYQIGSGTSLDVREAQVKLTRAEETLISAQYNAMITLSKLDAELGVIEQKIMAQQ